MRTSRLGKTSIGYDAERLRTLLPLRLLYDSGWELSAAGGSHTFTHNLGKLPLLWSILAADDSSGTDPVPCLMGQTNDGAWQGIRENNPVTTTTFNVYLHAGAGRGYAYNGTKWYVRGTDYIRLLIWAVGD